MGRAGGLDGVGEALRGQAAANPAGQPGEGQRDRTQNECDQCDPEQGECLRGAPGVWPARV
jgi:hypothetical protein